MVGDVIRLRWNGRDPSPGGVVASGIARYEVWRKLEGRPPRRIARTTATQLDVPATPGVRYRFYTIAVDNDGNRERRRL